MSDRTSDYRLDYAGCKKTLRERLGESAPRRIQILTGPRQVGKTTLMLELADEIGASAIYAAGDGPESSLPGAWERLWIRATDVAATAGSAVLMLDEVQHFPRWAERLKGEWDRVRRRRIPLHVLATGSSAVILGEGAGESLAGRFERLSLTHWSARAIAETFGARDREAAQHVVQLGGYPGAFELRRDLRRWNAYVRDAIIEPAIAKDILALADVRRPALLRQIFAVAVSSPAHIVSLQKLQGQLQDKGALETIAHYLELLDRAYLVAPLQKYSMNKPRQRAAPPKLVPLDNALVTATDSRGPPDMSKEPGRFGVWLENACLAFAWNSGQRVTYWREEPYEVDAIIDGTWGSWAVEVKGGGTIRAQDLAGLAEFVRRFPKYRPLVICGKDQLTQVERLGMPAKPWPGFLLEGPG